jgi:hypothetical protein
MSDWVQTVEHGAASARHEADIKRDVAQAIQQARREERERTEQAVELLREAVDRLVEFAAEQHDTWESAIRRKSPFVNDVQTFLDSLPEEASDE